MVANTATFYRTSQVINCRPCHVSGYKSLIDQPDWFVGKVGRGLHELLNHLIGQRAYHLPFYLPRNQPLVQPLSLGSVGLGFFYLNKFYKIPINGNVEFQIFGNSSFQNFSKFLKM